MTHSTNRCAPVDVGTAHALEPRATLRVTAASMTAAIREDA